MFQGFKWQVLKIASILLLGVILLDWVVITTFVKLFPNEMEWDTSPWYNFVHYNSRTDFKGQTGVFVAGSSVALFSALPEKIEKELKGSAKIRFYSHVAMSAADLDYYLDDVIAKKPTAVLYIVNPADFQLDHFRQNEQGHWQYSKKAWLDEYKSRFPVKTYYPGAFLTDYWTELEKRDLFFLSSKVALLMNRYRFFFMDPINVWIEHHFRKGKRYHNYTGSVPENGIWARGWSKQSFRLECTLKKGRFDESIYIPLPETMLEIQLDPYIVFKRYYYTSGWKSVHFSLPGEPERVTLKIHVDKSISSRVIDEKLYGLEYEYGVRLSQNFCKKGFTADAAYSRPLRLEDERFLVMSREEYRKDYFDRLYRDFEKRPELGRLKLVSDRKIQLAGEEFTPWLELEYLQKTAKRLHRAGITFIIVNNPENPLELEKYSNSKWYVGLMDFLKNLEGARFYNLNNAIQDPRMFIDFHHLTMHGALFMVQKYTKILAENLTHGYTMKEY